MPQTKDEFLEKLILIQKKNKTINELANQRQEEEKALVVEYKVDECNAKRSALIKKYQDLQAPILNEIESIRTTLSD